MTTFLVYSQLVVAISLIAAVLLQQRGQALGSAFGGSQDGFYATRRGLQKKLYWATIILGSLFIILSLANLII